MKRHLILLLILGFCPSALAEDLAGPAVALDGDTLIIRGRHIRLHGIDAPEFLQTCTDGSGVAFQCGQVAKHKLESLIGQGEVRCTGQETDPYGRLVAKCWKDDNDLGNSMVTVGYAAAYRYFSSDYALAETAAREAKRGLWAGEFENPWDWKRRTGISKPAATSPRPSVSISPDFRCGGKRYCGQMASCEEAKFYLHSCGLTRLDADSDGVPCETICR